MSASIIPIRFVSAFVGAVTTLTAAATDFVPVADEVPTVDFGTVERFTACMSGETVPFTIDIWLPDGYRDGAEYPVIYMADGQNIFDKDKSFAGVAWEVEQKITQLVRDGKIPGPAIVVGIGNRGAHGLREADYFPEDALANIPADAWSQTYLPADFRRTCRGNEYAAFVAHDVKEFVDTRYRTKSGPEHTFTMGSSMGALISLYIMCEYPDRVGGAACMSTHWIGSVSATADNGYTMSDDPVCAEAILKYFGVHLPAPGKHILYLDEGDMQWDALYIKYNEQMTLLAENKGYSESDGTLMVKYWTASGHNEWYWQQHCAVPIEFLLTSHNSGVSDIEADARTSGMICSLDGIPKGTDPGLLPPGLYCRKGKKFVRK